ncbi:MAG: hypothetical protein ACI4DU_06895 [Lachnospiraceae bacterium]
MAQAAKELYKYNADELIQQQCRAREEYYKQQRTLHKTITDLKRQHEEDQKRHEEDQRQHEEDQKKIAELEEKLAKAKASCGGKVE